MKKAVFLDRDGVLNKSIIKNGKPFPPKNLDELIIPDEVKSGIIKLKKEKFILIMITNQPDISRGKTNITKVKEINEYVKNMLGLDDIFMCIHDDVDNCKGRKPNPGMIFDAKSKWNIDLQKSFLIGDRWKDIQAGKNAGIGTFLLEHNYEEKKLE